MIDKNFIEDLLRRIEVDPRGVLVELISNGKDLPGTIRAAAYIAVQTMQEETIRTLSLDIANALNMYLEGDGSGILDLARARGIPKQFLNLIEANIKLDRSINNEDLNQ